MSPAQIKWKCDAVWKYLLECVGGIVLQSGIVHLLACELHVRILLNVNQFEQILLQSQSQNKSKMVAFMLHTSLIEFIERQEDGKIIQLSKSSRVHVYLIGMHGSSSFSVALNQ